MTKTGNSSSGKKRGSSKRPSAKGRPSSSLSGGKRKEKSRARRKSASVVEKDIPLWAHWTATVSFALLMGLGAYFLLIRPYAYRWKPCYGTKEYEVCMPGGMELYGIDVSHHQGLIDWSRVSECSGNEYPLRFVFIKATEGGNFKDENYDYNIEEARKSGLSCGSYLFYNPSTPPELQAGFFIHNVSLRAGDLPPVLDVEKHGDSREEFQRDILKCVAILESYYGVKPVIYTSYKFKKRYLDTPELNGYPFWMAHYYVEKPDNDAAWTLWQFTDRGRVSGIDGYTDLNAFNGTMSDFRKLLAVRDVDRKAE